MFDDLEPKTKDANLIRLGEDVSTLSLDDLTERVSLLSAEINRLNSLYEEKSKSLNAAEAFFKKPT